MVSLFAMVGVPEMLVIGVVVLLLFGNRLPSVMRSMGRSVVEFKKGVNEAKELPNDVDEENRAASGKA